MPVPGGGSVEEWTAEDSVGGYTEALELLREFIADPIEYSDEAQRLGIKWRRGLLLYGPPGTGKTSLVRAVVRECNAHLIIISPYMVHKGHAGESEKFLREAFSDAFTKSKSSMPSVIFIDEIDALCPRRDFRRQQGVRLTSQLATLMDSNKPSPGALQHVVVIAATNRVEAIDPCLRRHGRFDAELEITAPTEEERVQILKFYTKRVRLHPNAKLESIASLCNGYVGSDLEDLCRQATDNALRRCSESIQDDYIPMLTLEDWNHARSIVRPSITRGVTVEIPKVTWDDIGGLKDLKKKLQKAVEWPIKHSAAFSRLGISPIRGVLLHGPPGCSKTTLAKAVANAAHASFFSLSGSQLYSMYVGEGETLLRNTFRRASLAAPSILFFDEADVIGTKREGRSGHNSAVEERLLSTLLTEMDGLEQAKGILVLAATNRPQAIDEALLRPGRFDLVLYVPPPDLESRLEILRVHTRSMRIGDGVDLKEIAAHTDRFTGAELMGLCSEAGYVALREDIGATAVHNRHFQTAMRSMRPALSETEIQSYASFSKRKAEDTHLGAAADDYNGDAAVAKGRWGRDRVLRSDNSKTCRENPLPRGHRHRRCLRRRTRFSLRQVG